MFDKGSSGFRTQQTWEFCQLESSYRWKVTTKSRKCNNGCIGKVTSAFNIFSILKRPV